jgi:hypothetical protein
MPRRTGITELPLHYGATPPWLFERMKTLARQITLVLVEEFGPLEVVRRLADPFWFQAFGCVLGFDWHSSGITTVVCGALKEALRDIARDTGLYVVGGKGKTSRRTPDELVVVGERTGVDPAPLIYASRMAAKVDNAGLQDGYQIYHHTFIYTPYGEHGSGAWCVVQQGMNPEVRLARRYHWLSTELQDFVCEPHKAICCDKRGDNVLNMVAHEAEQAREMSARLAGERPERVVKDLKRLQQLHLPRRHETLISDIDPSHIKKVLLRTYERSPENFEALLATQGVGPKTVRALALVSELIYGAPASFRDPVRFSYAHGGKDGHPYPVERETYDRTIETLRAAVTRARLGRRERLDALRRLAAF